MNESNARLEELEEKIGDLREELAHCRAENDRMSLIVTHFSDGLILLDEEDRVALINPSARNLLRLHSSDPMGRDVTEIESVETANLWLFLNEVKGAEGIEHTREVTLSDELRARVRVVEIDSHRIIVLHDTTREQALSELKGEFVSIAAHQMRTPLSAIKWAFEIALSALDPKTEQAAAVRRGYESTDRVLEVVNSLLDVDRIESGRFDYRYERMDIGEFARIYVEEVAEEKALLHGVRIHFQNDIGGSAIVNGDADKLRIILQNLIENSLKYTQAGGEVRIIMSSDKEFAQIAITDTGIGIPEAAQARLFEKFYRASNAKLVVPDGSGLGLYIVKSIAEAHGGSVGFESEVGKGSTFYVRIPLYNQ